ncbi:MAG: biopolymer transporter ExbD [Pirellulales bacterium]|nr:biopolymer transporter ExbD [Pirellulales bacterium]
MNSPATTDTTINDLGPVFPRRRLIGDGEADMTPMIDMTFLLLIFFLVTFKATESDLLELPEARHGGAVGKGESVIFSLDRVPGRAEARVYLGEDEKHPLPDDHARQAAEIRAAVESGQASGRPHVLIKADRAVHYRDVSRVAAVVGEVEGVQLHFAVADPE